MTKICPMNNNECNENCAMYISPDELNEVVMNKLASLGVLSRTEGICSYKHLALCMGRKIYENNAATRYGR